MANQIGFSYSMASRSADDDMSCKTPSKTITSARSEEDKWKAMKGSPRSVVPSRSCDGTNGGGKGVCLQPKVRAEPPSKKRLDLMSACFGGTCLGGSFGGSIAQNLGVGASKAQCNDDTRSPSFLVLDGIGSISLGTYGETDESGDKWFAEAIERWTKSIASRVCRGTVQYEYRQQEEKFVVATPQENPVQDEQLVSAALNLAKTGSFVSQKLTLTSLPNVSIDTEVYLPPSQRALVVHLQKNDFEAAAQLMDEVVQHDRERYGDDDLIVAVGLHNKAVVSLLAGLKHEALYYFHEAVVAKKECLGENRSLISDSLVEVGVLLFARGDHERALTVFEEALALHDTSLLATEDVGASCILNNIGCLQFKMGNVEKALVALEKASAIQRMFLGSNVFAETALLNYALTQANMGHVMLSLRANDAVVILEEALLVLESVLGECDSLTIKSVEENIARCKGKSVVDLPPQPAPKKKELTEILGEIELATSLSQTLSQDLDLDHLSES